MSIEVDRRDRIDNWTAVVRYGRRKYYVDQAFAAEIERLQACERALADIGEVMDAVRYYSQLHNARGSDGPCDCQVCRALDRYDAAIAAAKEPA